MTASRGGWSGKGFEVDDKTIRILEADRAVSGKPLTKEEAK